MVHKYIFVTTMLFVTGIANASDKPFQKALDPAVHQFADGIANSAVSNPKFALELLYMAKFQEEYSHRNDTVWGATSTTPSDFNNHFYHRSDSASQSNTHIDDMIKKDTEGTDITGEFLKQIIGVPLMVTTGAPPVAKLSSDVVSNLISDKLNESSKEEALSKYDNWLSIRADHPEKYYPLYYGLAVKLREGALESKFVDSVVTPRIIKGTGGLTPRLSSEQILALRTKGLGDMGPKQKAAAQKYAELAAKPENAKNLSPTEKKQIRDIAEQGVAELLAENQRKTAKQVQEQNFIESANRKAYQLRSFQDHQMVGIMSDLMGFADPTAGAITRITLPKMLDISEHIELARGAAAAMEHATTDIGKMAAEKLKDQAISSALLSGAGMVTSLVSLLTSQPSQESLMFQQVLKELVNLRQHLHEESTLIRSLLQSTDSRVIKMHKTLLAGLDKIIANQRVTYELLSEVDLNVIAVRNSSREYFLRLADLHNASERENVRKEYETWFIRCADSHKSWKQLSNETLKWCFEFALREATFGSAAPWARGSDSPSLEEVARWKLNSTLGQWSWADFQAAAVYTRSGISESKEGPTPRSSERRSVNPNIWADFVDAYTSLAARYKSQFLEVATDDPHHLRELSNTGLRINSSIKDLVLTERGKPDYELFRDTFNQYWLDYRGALDAGFKAEARAIEEEGKGWNIFATEWQRVTRQSRSPGTEPIPITYCEDDLGQRSPKYAAINKANWREHPALYTFPVTSGEALMARFPDYVRAGADLALFKLEICISEPRAGGEIFPNPSDPGHSFVPAGSVFYGYKPSVTIRMFATRISDGRRLEASFDVKASTFVSLKRYGYSHDYEFITSAHYDFPLWANQYHEAKVKGKVVWRQELQPPREGSDLLNEFVREKWGEIDEAITRKARQWEAENKFIMSRDHVCSSHMENGKRVHICHQGPAVRSQFFHKALEEQAGKIRSVVKTAGHTAFNNFNQASGVLAPVRIEADRNALLALTELAFPRSTKNSGVVSRLDSEQGLPGTSFLKNYWEDLTGEKLKTEIPLEPLDPLACVVATDLPDAIRTRREREVKFLNQSLVIEPSSTVHLVSLILDGKAPLGLLADNMELPDKEMLTELGKLGVKFSPGGIEVPSMTNVTKAAYKNPTTPDIANYNRELVTASIAWRTLQAIICLSNLLQRTNPVESHPVVDAGLKQIALLRAYLSLSAPASRDAVSSTVNTSTRITKQHQDVNTPPKANARSEGRPVAPIVNVQR